MLHGWWTGHLTPHTSPLNFFVHGYVKDNGHNPAVTGTDDSNNTISTVDPPMLHCTLQEMQHWLNVLCGTIPHMQVCKKNLMNFTSNWLTPQVYSFVCPIPRIQVKNNFSLNCVLVLTQIPCINL